MMRIIRTMHINACKSLGHNKEQLPLIINIQCITLTSCSLAPCGVIVANPATFGAIFLPRRNLYKAYLAVGALSPGKLL